MLMSFFLSSSKSSFHQTLHLLPCVHRSMLSIFLTHSLSLPLTSTGQECPYIGDKMKGCFLPPDSAPAIRRREKKKKNVKKKKLDCNWQRNRLDNRHESPPLTFPPPKSCCLIHKIKYRCQPRPPAGHPDGK